jgi:hypothetical protein
MPVISNVRHHGRLHAHSLRSALKAMHAPFSAFFHSGQSAKYLARLPLLLSWFRGSFAGPFFKLSTLGFQCSLRLASPAVHAASLSVSLLLALRAAVLRLAVSSLVLSSSPVLHLRSSTALCRPQSRLFLVRFYRVVCLRQRWHTSVTSAPCQHALPNPSIERTCPGKPGHASHLKR